MSHTIAVMYLGKIVEWGDAGGRGARAQASVHAGALRGGAAHRSRRRRARTITLSRRGPEPARSTAGCRFHPRCPFVMPHCATDEPARLPPWRRAASRMAWSPLNAVDGEACGRGHVGMYASTPAQEQAGGAGAGQQGRGEAATEVGLAKERAAEQHRRHRRHSANGIDVGRGCHGQRGRLHPGPRRRPAARGRRASRGSDAQARGEPPRLGDQQRSAVASSAGRAVRAQEIARRPDGAARPSDPPRPDHRGGPRRRAHRARHAGRRAPPDSPLPRLAPAGQGSPCRARRGARPTQPSGLGQRPGQRRVGQHREDRAQREDRTHDRDVAAGARAGEQAAIPITSTAEAGMAGQAELGSVNASPRDEEVDAAQLAAATPASRPRWPAAGCLAPAP